MVSDDFRSAIVYVPLLDIDEAKGDSLDYLPGMLALLSGAIGFVTLHVVDIGVIKELGTAAGVGVAVIILTNLVLVPILLSYTGVSDAAVEAVLRKQKYPPVIGRFLACGRIIRSVRMCLWCWWRRLLRSVLATKPWMRWIDSAGIWKIRREFNQSFQR